MHKLFLLFATLLITYSGLNSKQEHVSTQTEYNILFVGNSLTYTNNLPKLVKEYAQLQGITLKTKMLALPNYAIEDHWKDGKVQKLITKNQYDFVIIQQGPSSQEQGRNMLVDYGNKFSSLCTLNSAKLCYFMVWPALNNYHTYEGVIKNHKEAAATNDAILLPVGQVWKDYFERTNNFAYYGPDGFHPSLAGSKMAAQVIVEQLFME